MTELYVAEAVRPETIQIVVGEIVEFKGSIDQEGIDAQLQHTLWEILTIILHR